MIGSPFAQAAEAPGRGHHWGMATPHAGLPRGTRIKVGVSGSLEQILFGPTSRTDGTQNLVGALRTCMGVCGAATLREMHEDRDGDCAGSQDRRQELAAGDRRSMTARRRATHRVATSDDVEVGTYLEIAEAESQANGDTRARPHPPASAEPTARDAIAIVDFGSQYSQLIARRVREHHVYCELIPHDVSAERLAALAPKGFILSGGPASVYAEGAPLLPRTILDSGKPILGICYGMQVLAHQLGWGSRAQRQAGVRTGGAARQRSAGTHLSDCYRRSFRSG